LKIAMKDSIVCLKAKEDNTKFHKTLIRLSSIPKNTWGNCCRSGTLFWTTFA
jgi:hypothetical protein